VQSMSIDHTIPMQPLAVSAAAPEALTPVARLALLLAVCAASWAVVLGLGYGVARLL
jgi:hypothetical protein